MDYFVIYLWQMVWILYKSKILRGAKKKWVFAPNLTNGSSSKVFLWLFRKWCIKYLILLVVIKYRFHIWLVKNDSLIKIQHFGAYKSVDNNNYCFRTCGEWNKYFLGNICWNRIFLKFKEPKIQNKLYYLTWRSAYQHFFLSLSTIQID